MEIRDAKAVIGTNSWGSPTYERVLRGNAVGEATLRSAAQEAVARGLAIFDTAQDYGLGKGQPLLGKVMPREALVSAKFTPLGPYRQGQVAKSLEKDLSELRRDHVDVYWLHLPRNIEQNLAEIVELYQAGKAHAIGVSNFNLAECELAASFLARSGIELAGVQNHYSLLARDWEREGLLAWCAERGIPFWAWAPLEEGMLARRPQEDTRALMKSVLGRQRAKLDPLYDEMERIGAAHGLSIAQVAMAHCVAKGIVPVVGCRKPEQVEQLAQAVATKLAPEEVIALETAADACGAHGLGADLFRFAAGGKADGAREDESFLQMTKGLLPRPYIQRTRRFLNERYGARETSRIWSETKANYLRFLADLPEMGGSRNGHAGSIYGSLIVFALYAALPDHPTPAELQDFSNGLFMEPFERLGKVFDLNRNLDMDLIDKVFKGVGNRDRKDAERWPDGFVHVSEPYDRAHHVARYRFTHCPVAEFAKAHDMLDVLPLMCNSDFYGITQIHGALVREGTCGNSDECDYCVMGSDNPLAAEYELASDEQGFWVSRRKES